MKAYLTSRKALTVLVLVFCLLLVSVLALGALADSTVKTEFQSVSAIISDGVDIRMDGIVSPDDKGKTVEVRYTFYGKEETVTVHPDANGTFSVTVPVGPGQINGTISANLYVDDKPVYEEAKTTSVKEYCVYQLQNSKDEDLKTLVSDVLLYGAASLRYLDDAEEAEELLELPAGVTLSGSMYTAPAVRYKDYDGDIFKTVSMTLTNRLALTAKDENGNGTSVSGITFLQAFSAQTIEDTDGNVFTYSIADYIAQLIGTDGIDESAKDVARAAWCVALSVDRYKGHSYSDVTSGENGMHSRTCTRCAAVDTVSCTYNKVITAPTCTEGGYTTYTCIDCHYSYTGDETPVSGHRYATVYTSNDGYHWRDAICGCEVEGADYGIHVTNTSVTAPSCTSPGYTTESCETCDYERTYDFTPTTSHVVTTWTEQEDSYTLLDASSCLYTATFTGTCSSCKNTVSKTDTVERHTFFERVTTTATCVSEGYKGTFCASEGCKYHTAAYQTTSYHNSAAHVWEKDIDASTEELTVYTCSVDDCTASKREATGNTTTIDKGTNEVTVGGTTIELDGDMQSTLGDKAEIKSETITGDALSGALAGLDEDQKALVDKVYDFTLTTDQEISDLGGTATIRIPYELSDGDDPSCIVIWYIKNGEVTPVEAVYEEDADGNGYVTFSTDHFSYYTVVRMTPEEYCKKFGHATGTTVAPTCDRDGYSICRRCGQIIPDLISPATGHTLVNTVATPASCDKNGLMETTCAVCGLTYTSAIPAVGHTYRVESETAVTCQTPGVRTEVCAACEATRTETTPALGHTYLSTDVAPTCTEAGYTVFTCKACGTEARANYTAALPHTPSEGYTATADGHATTCVSCGGTLTTGAHIPGAAATENEPQTCTVCDYVIKPATGHIHKGTLVKANDPSCLASGNIAYYVCCGIYAEDADMTRVIKDPTSVIVPPLGHSVQKAPAKAPTCTEDGFTASEYCERCETELVKSVDIPAKGHVYTVASYLAPGCETEGNVHYTCSVCGDESQTDNILPATGHALIYTTKAPTCTTPGYTAQSCARCDKELNKTEVPELGHAFSLTPSADESGHWYTCVRCDATTDIEAHVANRTEPTERFSVNCLVCNFEIEEAKDHIHAAAESVAHTKPSCTTAGNTAYYVCDCGTWFYDEACTQVINRYADVFRPATGHITVFVPQTNPTCNTDGYTAGVQCTVCDTWLSGHEELPVSATHDKAYMDRNDTEHFMHCPVCGESYDSEEHVDKDGHGVCDVCFYEMKQEEEKKPLYTFEQDAGGIILLYQFWDNGTCTITLSIGQTAPTVYWMQDGSFILLYQDKAMTSLTGRMYFTKDGSLAPYSCVEHGKECDWQVSERREPTCTSEGYIQYMCSFCCSRDRKDSLGFADHDFVNGTCTMCGAIDPAVCEHKNAFTTSDESGHYDFCPACRTKLNFKEHYDADGDGECDRCSGTSCMHDSAYMDHNDAQHYMYCKDCGEHFDIEDHIDRNSDGSCDVCGSGGSVEPPISIDVDMDGYELIGIELTTDKDDLIALLTTYSLYLHISQSDTVALPITADMIDLSDVSFGTVGAYQATISYSYVSEDGKISVDDQFCLTIRVSPAGEGAVYSWTDDGEPVEVLLFPDGHVLIYGQFIMATPYENFPNVRVMESDGALLVVIFTMDADGNNVMQFWDPSSDLNLIDTYVGQDADGKVLLTYKIYGTYDKAGQYVGVFTMYNIDADRGEAPKSKTYTFLATLDLENRSLTCPLFGTMRIGEDNSLSCYHNYETKTEPATCQHPGYTETRCTQCGDQTFYEELPMLEHDFVNGTCTECGASLIDGSDFETYRTDVLNDMARRWSELCKTYAITEEQKQEYEELRDAIRQATSVDEIQAYHNEKFADLEKAVIESASGSDEKDYIEKTYLEQKNYLVAVGTNVEDFLANAVIGKNIYLEWSQSGTQSFAITRDMIATPTFAVFEGIGTTYELELCFFHESYNGTFYICVTVTPDMSSATALGTYTCTLATSNFTQVMTYVLYSNGYLTVEAVINGVANPGVQYCTYTLEGTTLTVDSSGVLMLLTINEEDQTLSPLKLEGDILDTYTIYETDDSGNRVAASIYTVYGPYKGAGDYLCSLLMMTSATEGVNLSIYITLDLDKNTFTSETFGGTLDILEGNELGCRHTDKDGNGICDKCRWCWHNGAYMEHNDAQHYMYCKDCGEQFDFEEHYDKNGDSICDVCDYGMGGSTEEFEELERMRTELERYMQNEWDRLCSRYDVSKYEKQYSNLYSRVKEAGAIEKLNGLRDEFESLREQIENNAGSNTEKDELISFDTDEIGKTVTTATDLETYLTENVVGRTVTLYLSKNGEVTVTVTRDMIDIPFISFQAVGVGVHHIYIHCPVGNATYEVSVPITVNPDMTTAGMIGKYKLDTNILLALGFPAASAPMLHVYDNDWSTLDGHYLSSYYDELTGLLRVTIQNVDLFFLPDNTTGTAPIYVPDGEPFATYTYKTATLKRTITVYGIYIANGSGNEYFAIITSEQLMTDESFAMTTKIVLNREEAYLYHSIFGELKIAEDGTLYQDECRHESTNTSVQLPTCTQSGFQTTTCTQCGEQTCYEELPMLAHDVVNGTCTMCGALMGEEEGTSCRHVFPTEYTYDETGHWRECSYGCGRIADMAEHVYTKLANACDNCRYGHVYIESVQVGDGIKQLTITAGSYWDLSTLYDHFLITRTVYVEWTDGTIETIEITADMLSADVNLSSPGTGYVYVNYPYVFEGEHRTGTVPIRITVAPNMEGVVCLGTFTFPEYIQMHNGWTTISVYKNGYLLMDDNDEYLPYDTMFDGRNVYLFRYDGACAIVECNTDDMTVDLYQPTGNQLGSFHREDGNTTYMIVVYDDYVNTGFERIATFTILGYDDSGILVRSNTVTTLVCLDTKACTLSCDMLGDTLHYDASGNLFFPEEEGCDHKFEEGNYMWDNVSHCIPCSNGCGEVLYKAPHVLDENDKCYCGYTLSVQILPDMSGATSLGKYTYDKEYISPFDGFYTYELFDNGYMLLSNTNAQKYFPYRLDGTMVICNLYGIASLYFTVNMESLTIAPYFPEADVLGSYTYDDEFVLTVYHLYNDRGENLVLYKYLEMESAVFTTVCVLDAEEGTLYFPLEEETFLIVGNELFVLCEHGNIEDACEACNKQNPPEIETICKHGLPLSTCTICSSADTGDCAHKTTDTKRKEPSCQEPGYLSVYCLDCKMPIVDQELDILDHTPDENGICTVCEAVTDAHVHSYSEEWVKTYSAHYHTCVCGAIESFEEHIDENANGVCAVCSYNMTEALEARRTEVLTEMQESWENLIAEYTSEYHDLMGIEETYSKYVRYVTDEANYERLSSWLNDFRNDIEKWRIQLKNGMYCRHLSTETKQKDATCYYKGVITTYCAHCGQTVKEEMLPTIAHTPDENGICIVCKKPTDMHEHTFSGDWCYDRVAHYHICACGETDAYVSHADGNEDGLCDDCYYDLAALLGERREEVLYIMQERWFDLTFQYDVSEHYESMYNKYIDFANRATSVDELNQILNDFYTDVNQWEAELKGAGCTHPEEMMSPYTVTIDPTCNTNGRQERTCFGCGLIFSESIPATGEHAYGDGTTDSCIYCGTPMEGSAPSVLYTIQLAATGTDSQEIAYYTFYSNKTCEIGIGAYTCVITVGWYESADGYICLHKLGNYAIECGKLFRTADGAIVQPECDRSAPYAIVFTSEATCVSYGMIVSLCATCAAPQVDVIGSTDVHDYGDDDICDTCGITCEPAQTDDINTLKDTYIAEMEASWLQLTTEGYKLTEEQRAQYDSLYNKVLSATELSDMQSTYNEFYSLVNSIRFSTTAPGGTTGPGYTAGGGLGYTV